MNKACIFIHINSSYKGLCLYHIVTPRLSVLGALDTLEMNLQPHAGIRGAGTPVRGDYILFLILSYENSTWSFDISEPTYFK